MFVKKSTLIENILILGLGGIGFYLAKRLEHEGYSVTAIESESAVINAADASLDARIISGNAVSIECWKEVNAGEMDYLIAVTDSDAVNMFAAKIADHFGIEQKICRVRSLEYGGKNSFLSAEDLPKLMELTGVRQQRRHRVMILGGGLVGSRIAELLDKTVHVTLIEKNEKRAEELSAELADTEILYGDGSDREVLLAAGLLDMDTFISTTGENETNIMSCLLVKHLMSSREESLNAHRKTIALVTKEDYQVLASTSGSDIALNKKILAGNEILTFIRRSELLAVSHLHGFNAEVVDLVAPPDSPITQTALSMLDSSLAGKVIIGSVFRDNRWQAAVGNTHIQPGERVIVVCDSLHLRDVRELFSF